MDQSNSVVFYFQDAKKDKPDTKKDKPDTKKDKLDTKKDKPDTKKEKPDTKKDNKPDTKKKDNKTDTLKTILEIGLVIRLSMRYKILQNIGKF